MKWADFSFEKKLWDQSYNLIAGLDEVGRGSWAGPVVAAAVIFPPWIKLDFALADSKLLTPKKREELSELIKESAQSYSIAEVGLGEINKEGIGKASQRAFRQALRKLPTDPDFLLMDAFFLKYVRRSMQLPIIKGDQKSASIAAASILAKVYRDQLMVRAAVEFPHYGFDQHKGYGTRFHQEAITSLGFSTIHRTGFNLKFLEVGKS